MKDDAFDSIRQMPVLETGQRYNLSFIVLKARHQNLCLLRVGPRNGLAAVAQ